MMRSLLTFIAAGLQVGPSSAGEGLALISWLRSNGGIFSEKVEFRHLDPNDETSPNGLFAKEALEQNETIMVIPHKCLFTSPEGVKKSFCATTRALVDHYHRGDESFFKDYVEYLFDGTKGRKIPDRWSEEGKDILQNILGEELPSLFEERSFEDSCRGSGDPIEEDAYEFVIARSWTEIMIPVYDMVNHRNGHWKNVEATSAHVGQDVTVYVDRDVPAGEQLYMSYNECLDFDCEGLFYIYGTQEIVSDYGFVEQYPQRWIWDSFPSFEDRHEPLIYELDKITAPDPYSQELTEQFQVTWHTKSRPDLQMINVMTSLLKSLEGMKDYVQETTDALTSEHEKYTIREYYNAVQLALQYAIWSSYDEAVNNIGTSALGTDDEETKQPNLHHYDNLEKRPVIGNPDDAILYVCHPSKEFMGKGYVPLYKVKSQYQTIEFKYGIEENDTCLWLSGWGQTCTSFRQYHEALVHYPASFLPEIKRVAYIGGGDNMILHEILKYPSIELVVGMELDQQVVRYSFMNLGTLPYFDDPRVQWWFGDATKSLLMLPEEYFGSFDLVLVDLQTFVADALFVTDKLSIMDTMRLLLKGDGIISKNEDFPNRKITDFARYTVDMEYCDLPQICRQSITIGSNGVNFLKAPQYNHSIDRLYIKESLEPQGKFNNWYNFRNNQKIVDDNVHDEKPQTEENPLGARSHIGLLVVIEAEELSGTVSSKNGFVGVLAKVLKSHSLEVDSIDERHIDDQNFDVFILFYQGYIAVRNRPDAQNYVAMDLVLWDSIDKINVLKRDILNSIGGSEDKATSYRLVTGGIRGTEEKPYLERYGETGKICENHKKTERALDALPEDGAWTWLATLRPAEDASSLTLCGTKEQTCSGLEAMKSASTQSIALYSCDGMNSGPMDNEKMYSCEKAMMTTLRESMPRRINGILLDGNASQATAIILLRLLTTTTARAELFDDNFSVVVQLNDNDWREVFLERFRTEISPFFPTKEARLSFSANSRFALLSAGDVDFYNKLVGLSHALTTNSGKHFAVDSVMSGHARYVPSFDPPFFNNSAFDNTRAYEQWNSQQSIGFQTLFQMELQAPKTPLKVGERVLFQYDDHVWSGNWIEVEVARINEDFSYDLIHEDEGREKRIPRDKLRRLDFDVHASPMPTIDIGSRVLLRKKSTWLQGFVVSRSSDGRKYEVRQYDGEGLILEMDARDVMPQYEFTNQDALQSLSLAKLKRVFRRALVKALEMEAGDIPQTGHNIGRGSVITAFWEGGSAILVWDGLNHIDINFYLDEEDDDTVDSFQLEMLRKIPFLALVGRDEQPRGYGGVVNFSSEVRRDISPIWWRASSSARGGAGKDYSKN